MLKRFVRINCLKDLEIKRSYCSYGPDNITNSLLIPALKVASLYRRSVGFFSSSVFCSILDGVEGLVKNGGHIELIVSPKMSQEDIDAIQNGYKNREQVIKDKFVEEFNKTLYEMNDSYFDLTTELIKHSFMDIKVACTKEFGMYHDKLGIITDFHGNSIAFSGSANETYNGLSGHNNYEKIRVYKSWNEEQNEYLLDELYEFESLWNSKNNYVDTFDFTKFVRERVFEIIKNHERKNPKNSFKLRDYQETAIDKWVKNGFKGFFVMATGTGKTLTAIYSAKELFKTKEDNIITVIVAPYKHLIKQWAEDIKIHIQPDILINVSSENSSWADEIVRANLELKWNKNKKIVIVTTNSSFSLERFSLCMSKFNNDKLLIVDEAHRFMNQMDESIHETYKYLIGLSATPVSGKDKSKKEALLSFFGGTVANLPIEKALADGNLVPYWYHPIFIRATSRDEKEFSKYSRLMSQCFSGDILVDADALNRYKRAQLRIIAQCENKNLYMEDILANIKDKDHFIVYCGDGKMMNDRGGEERYIQFVKNILDKKGFKMSQFTAEESMDLRMQLIDSFNHGEINGLVAIRCLDEGVNIPTIKSAIVLASGDNLREFVQRRGRILRLCEGKNEAHIYDVIVLPSSETVKMAEIELRRFYEYARLSINKEENLAILYEYINIYKLDKNNIFNYFDTADEDGGDYDE